MIEPHKFNAEGVKIYTECSICGHVNPDTHEQFEFLTECCTGLFECPVCHEEYDLCHCFEIVTQGLRHLINLGS